MYIASSQTNCQEICKMYLHWVCDRKLEGAAGEHLGWAAALPPTPAQGSSLQGLAPRRRPPATMQRMEEICGRKQRRERRMKGSQSILMMIRVSG